MWKYSLKELHLTSGVWELHRVQARRRGHKRHRHRAVSIQVRDAFALLRAHRVRRARIRCAARRTAGARMLRGVRALDIASVYGELRDVLVNIISS